MTIADEAEQEAADMALWDTWWAGLQAWERQLWLKRHREMRAMIRQGEDIGKEWQSNEIARGDGDFV